MEAFPIESQVMSFNLANVKWLCVVVLLIVVAGFLVPAGNHLSKVQIAQHQSDSQLKGISQLVLVYEKEHGGNAPRKMSDIIPDDRTNLLCMFHAPNIAKSQKHIDLLTSKASLDEYSDYGLPLNKKTNLLAFENPGLWSDGSIAVCFRDLSISRMNASNFNSLMDKDALGKQ
jgi:hypothetical protein